MSFPVPTTAHIIYIPFVLLLGIVIGFVLGGRAAREEEAMRQARKEERAARRAERASGQNPDAP